VGSGLAAAFEQCLAGLSGWLVVCLQQVATFSSVKEARLGPLGLPFLVVLGFLLVSGRIPWPRRLLLFGSAAVGILVAEAIGVAALLKLDSAERFLAREHIAVLSPWETRFLDAGVYLLVNIGPEAAVFIVMVLAGRWNGGAPVVQVRIMPPSTMSSEPTM
jgi:hypothetical protein